MPRTFDGSKYRDGLLKDVEAAQKAVDKASEKIDGKEGKPGLQEKAVAAADAVSTAISAKQAAEGNLARVQAMLAAHDNIAGQTSAADEDVPDAADPDADGTAGDEHAEDLFRTPTRPVVDAPQA
jgi:hypothetical protein